MFGKGLLMGLSITFKKMFERPNTVQYPEKRLALSPLFRGGTIDLNVGKCIACGLCAMACPNHAIQLETGKNEAGKKFLTQYVHDIPVCVYCNYCMEACPTKAISWTRNYEMSCIDKKQLVVDCLQETGKTMNEGGAA